MYRLSEANLDSHKNMFLLNVTQFCLKSWKIKQFCLKVCPKAGATICGVCNQYGLKTRRLIYEHFIKAHTIHYKCPVENCNYSIQLEDQWTGNEQIHLFKFARHIHFHNHPLPQAWIEFKSIKCNFIPF